MRALRQADGRRRVLVLHLPQVVDPRPGRVQHETGRHAELVTRYPVPELRAGHPAPGEAQARDLGVVEHGGTGLDGPADRHQRHPGVVHLVVAVHGHGLEVVRTQLGHVLRGLRRREQVPHAVTEGRQRRVREDTRAQLRRAVRPALVHGEVERERIRQVGGHLTGDRTALEVVLRHQLHRAGLQVAQTAVEQLGGGGGGRAGEVAGVDQGHPQARLCGMPGGGDAQNPATDHQEVVCRLGQLLPGLGTAHCRRTERGGAVGRARPESRDTLQGGH